MTESWFVAFYSYKGGVGRTMALANTAYALASHGKRVVVVDLDLEAPSLDAFSEFKLADEGARGLMDLARAYAATGVLPAVRDVLHPTPHIDGGGGVWVLPAGARGAAYTTTLGELNWRRLHPERGTLPFVDGLREGIASSEIQPHYVLIDARTGLSDVGGLSTHLLADEVVLVFNLTRPCLEGTVRAYHSMVAGHPDRPGKALRLALVASPVPAGSDSLVVERLRRAAELMPLASGQGRGVLRINYDPGLVLCETLAVRQPEVYESARRYEQLRELLQRDNPDEVFSTLERAGAARKVGKVAAAVDEVRGFVTARPENAEGHEALGALLLELGRVEEAISELQRALELGPGLTRAPVLLGRALLNVERAAEGLAVVEQAERRGRRERELFELKRDLLDVLGRKDHANEAQRRALQVVLRNIAPAYRQEVSDEGLDRLVASPRVTPGLEFARFIEQIVESPHLNFPAKRDAVTWFLRGNLDVNLVSTLAASLADSKEFLRRVLGPRAGDIETRLRETCVDPQDPKAVLSIQDGTSTDIGLLMWAGFLLGDATALPPLREATSRAPETIEAWRLLWTKLMVTAAELNAEGALGWLYEAGHVANQIARLVPDEAGQYLLSRELAKLVPDPRAGSAAAPSGESGIANTSTAGQVGGSIETLIWFGKEMLRLSADAGDNRDLSVLQARIILWAANALSPHSADFPLACADTALGDLDAAERHLSDHLQRHPSDLDRALAEPLLQPLWDARPELRARLTPGP